MRWCADIEQSWRVLSVINQGPSAWNHDSFSVAVTQHAGTNFVDVGVNRHDSVRDIEHQSSARRTRTIGSTTGGCDAFMVRLTTVSTHAFAHALHVSRLWS
jgi:hypothetical protein